jgi:hypothetical protein
MTDTKQLIERAKEFAQQLRFRYGVTVPDSLVATWLEASVKALSSVEGEPVYQYQKADGSWIDQAKDSYDYNVQHGSSRVRVLYTRPQPGQAERQALEAGCCRSHPHENMDAMCELRTQTPG